MTFGLVLKMSACIFPSQNVLSADICFEISCNCEIKKRLNSFQSTIFNSNSTEFSLCYVLHKTQRDFSVGDAIVVISFQSQIMKTYLLLASQKCVRDIIEQESFRNLKIDRHSICVHQKNEIDYLCR